MDKKESSRRSFVKRSALGFGALAFSSFTHATKRDRRSALHALPDQKINVLCIGAHPGDPEFGCGGTLAKYSQAGHKVSILYLTRGEAGDPTKTYEQSAALRTAEALKACKELNATPLFAGQVDANTELTKKSREAVVQQILAQQPNILFTHWPVDTHPDHQISGLLGFNAWTQAGQTFDLYFYEVNTGSETLAFEPTDYVDITDVRERKKSAMFAHQTQRPEEVYDTFFKTMEEFRGLEAGVKAAEGFLHFKPKKEKTKLNGL